MASPFSSHPEEDVLTRYADEELSDAQMAEVEKHLRDCEECQYELHQIRGASRAYASFVAAAKRRMPPPPAPWGDLRAEMAELDRKPRVAERAAPVAAFPRRTWWLAAAAALLVAVVTYRFGSEQTVSAAELLEKAAVAERAQPEGQRRQIRMKFQNLMYTRPARLGPEVRLASGDPEAVEVFRARLVAANYSWEDPLSVRAYSDWRDGLDEKTDAVTVVSRDEYASGRAYRIATRTGSGELEEVALTLRASDLRPVHEVFRFRDGDPVEISDAGEWIEPPAAVEPGVALAKIEPSVDVPATLADELRVVAALHGVGADLGEPVEIQRDSASGKLIVSGVDLRRERQEQIRAAVAGLESVEVRFESSPPLAVPDRAPVREEAPDSPDALRSRLEAVFGGQALVDQFVNEVLESSEANLSRAYAIRNLARRFPPERERDLGPADRQLLLSMVDDHANAMVGLGQRLPGLLEPVLGPAATPAAAPCRQWQACAEELIETAQRLDGALNRMLASSGRVASPEQVTEAAARALHEWRARVAGLDALVDRR